MRVYTARWLLPVASPPVRDGAVAVDAAGRLAYVGPAAGAPPGAPHPLGDAVLLPGLVAAHLVTGPVAPGATTVAAPVTSARDRAALLASGLRAVAYHLVVGPTPAGRRAALAALHAAVARTRAVIAGVGATARVRPGIALGPLYTVDEDLLIDVSAWAVAEDLPLAITAGATADEVAYVRDAAGPHADRLRAAGLDVVRRAHSTVHLLAELGVAAVARPLLVGGAFFDESDIALAAYYGCPVAYAPVGTPPTPGPLPALRSADVPVVVATPAPLSTVHALTPTPAEALHLATLGAARALGLDAEVGSLEVGKAADLCAFPLSAVDLRLADVHDPTHALFATRERRPRLTVVAGRAPAQQSPPV